jgi:tetratricopeptide (TPR) repeat protein
MSENSQSEQRIFTGNTVGGDVTINGCITQNPFSASQYFENNPFALPQARKGELFGRNDKLIELHKLLQNGRNVCVVSGMGGVGKTKLVRYYANQDACQSHFSGGVFYIDARDRQDIIAGLIQLTEWKFKRVFRSELSEKQKIAMCWENWRAEAKKTLIILDDVVSLSNCFRDYLLPEDLENLKFLITSREMPDKKKFEKLDIEVLSPSAAVDFLCSIIGVMRIEKEMKQAELLCEELGYLPLALELVSYYLCDEDYQNLSLAAMKEKLTAKVKHPSLSPEQLPTNMRALRGLQAAFDLSWDDLSSEAQHLACVLGSFASAPISGDFIRNIYTFMKVKISNPDDIVDRWMKSLKTLHLVTRVTINTYDLHPLIRDYFREQFNQHPKHDEIKQGFCDLFANIANNVDGSTNLATFNMIEPHLKKMLTWSTCSKDFQLANSLNGLAILYHSQGRYKEAEPIYLHSIDVIKHLDVHHPNTIKYLNNLSELYKAQGRYYEVENLCRNALEIIEKQPVINYESMGIIFNCLAGLYKYQGRYSEAKSLHLKIEEIHENKMKFSNLFISINSNNLAELYRAQGYYKDAEPLYIQSLRIREFELRHNHPDIAISLNNLGELYREEGRYEEAEPLYQRAKEINEKEYGLNHPYVASNISNLALLYQYQGYYHKAEPLHIRALKIREIVLESDHPHIAISLSNLALFYQSQKEYDIAENFYIRSLAIDRRCYGEEHHEIAIDLCNLAMLYANQGKYNLAEETLGQSTDIFLKMLGEKHPDTQRALQMNIVLNAQKSLYCDQETLFDILEDFSHSELAHELDGITRMTVLEEIDTNPLILPYLRQLLYEKRKKTNNSGTKELDSAKFFVEKKEHSYT